MLLFWMLMMPDISGLEVVKFMRREPKLEKIPVIVISAKSMPSDIKIGMDAGASVYSPSRWLPGAKTSCRKSPR